MANVPNLPMSGTQLHGVLVELAEEVAAVETVEGPAGPQGIQGEPGPKGDKGDPGESVDVRIFDTDAEAEAYAAANPAAIVFSREGV